jgi:hypothetical protein
LGKEKEVPIRVVLGFRVSQGRPSDIRKNMIEKRDKNGTHYVVCNVDDILCIGEENCYNCCSRRNTKTWNVINIAHHLTYSILIGFVLLVMSLWKEEE